MPDDKQPPPACHPDSRTDRPDADVLAEAREGIARHRQGDCDLVLAGPDGRPAAGRTVRIVQTRTAFLFGSPIYEVAEAARLDRMHNPDLQLYAQCYTGLLNACTALCYWNERGDPWVEKFQGDTKFREFVMQADWANAHGLTVKGHPLVWTVEKAIPPWLWRYDDATRMKFLEVRVRNFVGGLRDKVRMWDLVNEMLWEPSMRHIAERKWPHLEPIPEILSYVAPAVQWARQENPDARLLINEYGLIHGPPAALPAVTAAMQRRRYVELAEALQKAGAAPDALGVQGHSGGRWFRMGDVKAALDELAQAGLPLHITEFGAGLGGMGPEGAALPEEEQLARQAEFAANFYTVAFGHPAVEAVSYWGLPSVCFPSPQGLLTRIPRRRAAAPMYGALRHLVREEWMTRLEATSDSAGRIRFRGFFGDYVLRYAEDRASVPFVLPAPGGSTIRLRLGV